MEKTVIIYLNSIDDIKKFVSIVSKYDGDFDLISGKYVVDAKSIMGIFSLNLSNTVQLNISCATPELMEELKPYIVSKNKETK